MRIGLITGEYPPMQGGVGDFTRELGRALSTLGHDVHIVTRFVAGAPAQETHNSVQVHRIISAWGWDVRRRLEAFARMHSIDVFDLQYQAAAYQMHPAINLLPAALSRHIPTVVTFHDLRVPYLFPKAGPLRWKAIVAMAAGAAASITTNDEDLEVLRREGVTRAHLAPIGSNIAPHPLPNFDRTAWLHAHGLDPQQIMIGYFGFMNESKGGETLMRALALLRSRGVPASVLHIGGRTGDSDPTNAAYADKLRALAAELDCANTWHETGFLDDAAVSEGFAACTAVALPYRDGASYRRGTLMAALAHGTAIVTTAPRVSVPAFVDGANMLLTPADSPTALADALQRIFENAALREQLQQGAAHLSCMFAWDAIAARTVAVFTEVARPSRLQS
ncbi:MAG: glycosyltransferase family 4 protein [Chloroflexi bacterium]|nr:glycosyltransferase family 4 protein [Chloroflexota bacterium]